MKYVPVQANRAIETVSWLFKLARDWCRRDITPTRTMDILMDEHRIDSRLSRDTCDSRVLSRDSDEHQVSR